MKKLSMYSLSYPVFAFPVKCWTMNASFVLFSLIAQSSFDSKVTTRFFIVLISFSLSWITIKCFCSHSFTWEAAFSCSILIWLCNDSIYRLWDVLISFTRMISSSLSSTCCFSFVISEICCFKASSNESVSVITFGRDASD